MSSPHRALRVAAPVLAIVLVALTLAPRDVPASGHLYAEGVRIGAHGGPESVPTGAGPDAAGPTWGGAVPGEGTRWEPMARRALADLDVLTVPTGDLAATAAGTGTAGTPEPGTGSSGVLAGWHPSWRYVWPRDASFAAAALAVSGRHDDAVAVLRFLQGVQPADGVFQARYTLDGGVPDDRGTQLDAVGWVLWAAWVLTASAEEHGVPTEQVDGWLLGLDALLTRSAAAAVASVRPGTGLPGPSPDYWEVRVRETTLGTAAPVLIGLGVAAELLPRVGAHDLAASAAAVRARTAEGIGAHFGRRGYPRVVSTRQMDAAVAFLMPPFTPAPPGQASAWERALDDLATPAGGLRPGVEFKDPEVSWTPQTALFAMTAAATGRDDVAERLLDWLQAHRTAVGSLPEKVDATGLPAAVAPLAWTACLVLLTLAALDGDLPTPP